MSNNVPGVLLFLIIMASFFLSVCHLDTIIRLATHHTFKPPYGYRIITNGEEYKYVTSSGWTNSINYKSKSKAVTRAWLDWELDQERERKTNAKWRTVEF